MIQDKYNIIFIHLPKCGGHSIDAVFDYSRRLTPKTDQMRRHATPSDYKKKWPNKWETYFKFTFVRNPYDRLISAWVNCANLYTKTPLKKLDHNDPDIFTNIIKPEFTDFVINKLGDFYNKSHFRPQCLWIPDISIYDFIGRCGEDMNKDIDKLCSLVGNKDYTIKRLGASKPKPFWRNYYTKKTLKIVAETYKKDFEIWIKVNND